MPGPLRQNVNAASNITVVVPLSATEGTYRGAGSNTMTATIKADSKAGRQLLDELDRMHREGSATIAYS